MTRRVATTPDISLVVLRASSSDLGTSPYAKIRLSLRADGVFTTERNPESRPIAIPAEPRTIESAYGFRFWGISTLARV